jgi:hypothetical protein
MTPLAKALAALTSAALLAATPALAGAADARPAAHQGGGTHQHGKPADPLAGPRRGATHAISAQLKAAQRLVDRAAALTIADASALQDALAADLAAVQTDLDGVAAASSKQDLHGLMSAATTSVQVARLQFRTVVAADAAVDQATALTATIATLGTELAALSGVDITAGQAALADATTALQTVTAGAPGVVSDVLAISPTASRADLHTAAAAVAAALTPIEDALAQAAADVATVQATYGL